MGQKSPYGAKAHNREGIHDAASTVDAAPHRAVKVIVSPRPRADMSSSLLDHYSTCSRCQSGPGPCCFGVRACQPGVPAPEADPPPDYCGELTAMMPTRRRNRAQNPAQRIATQRRHNHHARLALQAEHANPGRTHPLPHRRRPIAPAGFADIVPDAVTSFSKRCNLRTR